VPSQVPVGEKEIEVVGVVTSQCGGGGVVQVTPVHGSVHKPVAPSQVCPIAVQSFVVAV